MHVCLHFMHDKQQKLWLNTKEGRGIRFDLLKRNGGIRGLTSSTKITQVIWSPGVTVDRQAGRWPRVC